MVWFTKLPILPRLLPKQVRYQAAPRSDGDSVPLLAADGDAAKVQARALEIEDHASQTYDEVGLHLFAATLGGTGRWDGGSNPIATRAPCA